MNKGISTSTVGVAALLAGMMFQSAPKKTSATLELPKNPVQTVLPASGSGAS